MVRSDEVTFNELVNAKSLFQHFSPLAVLVGFLWKHTSLPLTFARGLVAIEGVAFHLLRQWTTLRSVELVMLFLNDKSFTEDHWTELVCILIADGSAAVKESLDLCLQDSKCTVRNCANILDRCARQDYWARTFIEKVHGRLLQLERAEKLDLVREPPKSRILSKKEQRALKSKK